jgi:kinesin family protein 4/21/27
LFHGNKIISPCRIAETRRQRLQQLEAQISDMKMKIKEQSKMLKMKQQKEEQVSKLSQEIQV